MKKNKNIVLIIIIYYLFISKKFEVFYWNFNKIHFIMIFNNLLF